MPRTKTTRARVRKRVYDMRQTLYTLSSLCTLTAELYASQNLPQEKFFRAMAKKFSIDASMLDYYRLEQM